MRTVRSFACEVKEAARFEDRLSNTLAVSRVCSSGLKRRVKSTRITPSHLSNIVFQEKAVAYLGYTWINVCFKAFLFYPSLHLKEFAENIILVAILFYAGHLAMNGLLTVNQATSFLLYQMQLGENFYVSIL